MNTHEHWPYLTNIMNILFKNILKVISFLLGPLTFILWRLHCAKKLSMVKTYLIMFVFLVFIQSVSERATSF